LRPEQSSQESQNLVWEEEVLAWEAGLQLHFLGTGGSEGIPCLWCRCEHCQEARLQPAFRRLPTAVLLQEDDQALLIDAGTDINHHLEKIHLLGVLLTHWHTDHWVGLPRLSWTPRPLPFLCPEPEKAKEFLKKGLVPLKGAPFCAENWGPFRLYPLPLNHSVLTWGYFIEHTSGQKVALLWDTKGLPPESLAFLRYRKVHLAVVDATYPPGTQPKNHNNLEEAIALGLEVADGVLLTHFSHKNWPPQRLEEFLSLRYPFDPVALAYDGLKHDLDQPLAHSLREGAFHLLKS